MRFFTHGALCAIAALCGASLAHANEAGRARYQGYMHELAAKHNVPERLIHRIIMRESRYQPHLVAHGNYGLMQIKPATARGMGYSGSPSGLLDGRTNMTYAVPYLANAYRIAGGNEDAAVRLYAGGYYYVAKRKGMLGQLQTAHAARGEAGHTRVARAEKPADRQTEPTQATAYAPQPAEQPGLLSFLFGGAQPHPVVEAQDGPVAGPAAEVAPVKTTKTKRATRHAAKVAASEATKAE